MFFCGGVEGRVGLTSILPSHTFSNDCSALGADCFRSTGACLHREPRLSPLFPAKISFALNVFFLTLTHLPLHSKTSVLDLRPAGHEFDTLALKAPANGGEVPQAIGSPGSARALSSETLLMV